VVQKLHLQPKLKLDRQQFGSVITNLLLNAREALGPGGEVRVETSQSNGWAVLSVADDGCGMSPAFLKTSLFRPFRPQRRRDWHWDVSIQDDCRSTSGEDPSRERTRSRHNFSGDVACRRLNLLPRGSSQYVNSLLKRQTT
jgi:Signal transduction histidine kinase